MKAAEHGTALAPRSVASGAGTFARGLLEAMVLLMALGAAEMLFFGEGYYQTLDIHPFWLVVLAAAIQNGAASGVAAAALAALFVDWPERPLDQDITEHYLALALVPLQWIVAALTVGLFRDTQRRRERSLLEQNAELERQGEEMAAEIVRMDDILSEFELRAATEQPDHDALVQALAALRSAAPADLPSWFRNAVALAGAEPAWLGLDGPGGRRDDALRLVAEAAPALDLASALQSGQAIRVPVPGGDCAGSLLIVVGFAWQPADEGAGRWGAVVFRTEVDRARMVEAFAEVVATQIEAALQRGARAAPPSVTRGFRRAVGE